MSDEYKGLSAEEQDSAAEGAKDALETDSLGRPVLPVSEAYQKAQEQGYYGYDGKDTGASVHPEDVGSFEENAARVDQPAHAEAKVIENPGGGLGGYSALNAPNAPAPVEGGDATSADAPARTDTPAQADSTGKDA